MTGKRSDVATLARGLARTILLPGTLIYVRRHPSDWQTAAYRFCDLEGLHWSSVSGGVGRRSSRPMLSAYANCDGMASGEVAHSCQHGPPPHRILVCLPKGLNRSMWSQLEARVP